MYGESSKKHLKQTNKQKDSFASTCIIWWSGIILVILYIHGTLHSSFDFEYM